MIRSILLEVRVLGSHTVDRNNDFKTSKSRLAGRGDNRAMGGGSYNDDRLDTFISQDFFQIGPDKLVSWRPHEGLAGYGRDVWQKIAGRRTRGIAVNNEQTFAPGLGQESLYFRNRADAARPPFVIAGLLHQI